MIDPSASAQQSAYRGRFAPSPSGPLHFGSLVAALGSYLQARQARGHWLLRIEDIDAPRSVPGAADNILRTLEAYGFRWDEPVIYQSNRTELYQQALQRLSDADLAYACSCSRSELQALNQAALTGGEELPYPGRCARGPLRSQGPHAWRFRVPAAAIHWRDGLQGAHCIDLREHIGDFVIKRRDGWFAYQLAVVVDDAAQRITQVVRGADLLLNTPRQIALQQALGCVTPDYLHLPLVVDAQGIKLAKANAAQPILMERATHTLWHALAMLRQNPPVALQTASLATLWQWADSEWNVNKLRGLSALCISP